MTLPGEIRGTAPACGDAAADWGDCGGGAETDTGGREAGAGVVACWAAANADMNVAEKMPIKIFFITTFFIPTSSPFSDIFAN